jgi:3-deoxy-7-phosphoheptulonate synthase
MLIVMKSGATESEIATICDVIQRMGFEPRPIPGPTRTAIGIVGNDGPIDPGRFTGLPGVSELIPVSAPFKLVSREWRREDSVVELPNGTKIGGGNPVVVMGGPCSVESAEQIEQSAKFVAEAGGRVLRGGAFKPRTSPYSFQGLGEDGLRMMRSASDAHGLAMVTEAIDLESAELVAKWADMIQIGARNMQNFSLLRRVGQLGKPVMLKRGQSATIKEWLLAAEYVAASGCEQIILCERGIRGFDTMTRNVMDVAAIPVAKDLTHLPVIGDPSHGTGRRDKILPLARATVAVGADGLIVEMHPDPNHAMSDGGQSLYPHQFAEMVVELRRVAAALGTSIA